MLLDEFDPNHTARPISRLRRRARLARSAATARAPRRHKDRKKIHLQTEAVPTTYVRSTFKLRPNNAALLTMRSCRRFSVSLSAINFALKARYLLLPYRSRTLLRTHQSSVRFFGDDLLRTVHMDL